MRFVRLLGITVIVYGFSYVMYGTMQLFGMVNYHAGLSLILLNACIGLISLVIGIGLLLAQDWARVSWLAVVTMLFTEHVFLTTLFFFTGDIPTLQQLNMFLISLLFLITWSNLTRSHVKQHFH